MAAENSKQQLERVVVEIYGGHYPFKTDNPEHIKQLAVMLDKRMKQTSHQIASFDDQKIAVLTALQLADEYQQLKQDYDELVALLDEK